jgi:hypothetical protein
MTKDFTPPPPSPALVPRKKLEFREYTLEELRSFNGEDPSKPVLLAVNGNVYDVRLEKATNSLIFYGIRY